MSTSVSTTTARAITGTESTSFSATVFAKYSWMRRRSRATSRVRIASWPKPASTVTSEPKARPKVKEPNAEAPSWRASTTKKPTEISLEPTSAAARKTVFGRIREVPEAATAPSAAAPPGLGCGAVPTVPTFYTIANAPFFPGLVGLLNSLRLSGNEGELVVLDRGLTAEQRARLEPHVRLVQLTEESTPHPTLLK